ncbi:Urease accessory protein UreH [Gracilibacillus ureilyticus]|uniref:Urease accessory protein UreH n=1 Tax=Gracilibacillus ureilyticus TaxID=531814 RepID=A0A1H9VJH6_9BACI|nr:urease accessory protein UreD [Gracilibacillus ureilyticus]SES21855.1 Urease accessory protein UreH [Gracilibacillus ureilyticus]
MNPEKLMGRFQKVNLMEYNGTGQLKLEKTDKTHRIFTTYHVTGLNKTGNKQPADINFIVMKGSNIAISPEKPYVVKPGNTHEQQISLQIEEEALLVWNNQEVIFTPGTNFTQRVKVLLNGNAEFVWAEIVHLTEKKDYHYTTLMEILVGDECLAFDPVTFSSENELMDNHGIIEDFTYTATVWYIAEQLPFDEWDVLERISQAKNHRAGMTDLDGKGILIRWLSKDLRLLKQEVQDVMAFFDQKITEIRKWRV